MCFASSRLLNFGRKKEICEMSPDIVLRATQNSQRQATCAQVVSLLRVINWKTENSIIPHSV